MATFSVASSLPTISHQNFSGQPPPTMGTQQPLQSQSQSPAYLETYAILTHLLTTLQSPTCPYHKHYSSWITHHTIPTLTTTLLSLIRPPVWTFLSTPLWSLDALKQISPYPGDLRYEGRAIYLNGILGLDKRLRVYVGQTTCLRQRVGQHLNFRHRRDNGGLHYFGLERSAWNVFAVLCFVPMGMDDVALTMNVLEMLMCLVFRCLPVETLRVWLPADKDEDGAGVVVSQMRRTSREGVVGGLNIACPLDQGLTSFKDQPFVDLSGEEDELVQEWLRELERKRGEKRGVSEKVLLEKKGVDRDEVEARKKAYAEKARGYNLHIEKEGVFVPHWVLLGAATVVVGWALFRSSGGPRRL